MINNRKVRLIQVAKEFKVGLNTIMDFLLKKGINVEGSPNSPVSPEVYAVLEKEFGSNRTITGNERENIRERISLKQTTVTLDEDRKQEKDDKEVIIKSNVINVKDEIPQDRGSTCSRAPRSTRSARGRAREDGACGSGT